MDVPEVHTLDDDVLGRTVGLVVFGVAQFTAMMKATESLVTLGIEAPTIATLWLEAAGMAAGLKAVIEAVSPSSCECE